MQYFDFNHTYSKSSHGIVCTWNVLVIFLVLALIVELCVRTVHCNRLLDWIKSCCYIVKIQSI